MNYPVLLTNLQLVQRLSEVTNLCSTWCYLGQLHMASGPIFKMMSSHGWQWLQASPRLLGFLKIWWLGPKSKHPRSTRWAFIELLWQVLTLLCLTHWSKPSQKPILVQVEGHRLCFLVREWHGSSGLFGTWNPIVAMFGTYNPPHTWIWTCCVHLQFILWGENFETMLGQIWST